MTPIAAEVLATAVREARGGDSRCSRHRNPKLQNVT
jgi:hypothetical protein